MKAFVLTDVLISLFNYFPLVIGASAQTYFIFRDIKKTILTLSAFVLTGLVAVLSVYLDNDINNLSDVNQVFVTMAIVTFVIFAVLFSKSTIHPLNGPKALIYISIFWVIVLELLFQYGTNTETNIIVVYPSILVTIIAVIISIFQKAPLRKFWEILVYCWVAVFLVVRSIIAFQQISADFGGKIIFSEKIINFSSQFFVGAIMFQAIMLVMSVLLMFPIFGNKKQPIRVELERAKHHSQQIASVFSDIVFDSRTGSLFVVVVLILFILKFGLSMTNNFIIFVGITLSDLLFGERTKHLQHEPNYDNSSSVMRN